MTPRISRAQLAKNGSKGFTNGMEITQCPPGYCQGYSDMGTYEPVPLVGDFWCEDFMPLSEGSVRLQTTASIAERQDIVRKDWVERNREKYLAYHRDYQKKRRK